VNVTVTDPLFALNQLTLLATVGAAGGLYLFVRGFRLLARKRLLLNTPTSKIRSASLGLVEVSGLATGPYTLPTPIAGRPCFFYRTTAWQQNGDSSREWKKVAEETLGVPFFLDDNTGKLLIEPKGADLDLHRDLREEYSDTIFSPHTTPQVLSFLARHGVKPSNGIRVEECSIQPQNPLFIVGTIAENPGVEVAAAGFAGDYKPGQTRGRGPGQPRTPSPEVVRLSQATATNGEEESQQSKVAAALFKAGITSPAAWEAAGVPYGSAERARLEEISVKAENKSGQLESAFDLTPPVVLMKGENNPAFVISWRSQHELVRSLAWKSAAMIWGGGALTLLGVRVLLQQFDLL
jgi:hypothetical protein